MAHPVSGGENEAILGLAPYSYIHVLDLNTNVTRLEVGPKNYVRQDNERITLLPERMITIPPRHFAVIENPVIRNVDGAIVLDPSGQAKLAHADVEIRTTREPFALYPGEILKLAPTPLKVVPGNSALLLTAVLDFEEDNVKRIAGDEWLFEGPGTYSPRKEVNVVSVVNITTLTNRQYCVILNPVGPDGRPQLGKRKLIKGEISFFLHPGESLESGQIQDIYVLSESEGLVLRAIEAFRDDELKVDFAPGDRWMIRGPKEYAPPVEAEVLARRKTIPLDENEGIYVRDMKSGKVRLIVGESYMLTQDEELWEKELPATVETLLTSDRDPLADRSERGEEKTPKPQKRDRTRAVTFRVPHNAAVQIYDYKEKKARVIFGPDLVMLGPEEHFTQLYLSGGKPKRPNVIKSLCLLLGPDFCTDVVTVETADHVRLSLQLSYNWQLDVGDKSATVASKLFSVPDFIGELCKTIASRVRGMVAEVQFDDFYKNSARIIRGAVFGFDDYQKVRDRFTFPQNNVVITSVDIQSVEPVDENNAQRVRHEAETRLERQKIIDEAETARVRKELLGETNCNNSWKNYFQNLPCQLIGGIPEWIDAASMTIFALEFSAANYRNAIVAQNKDRLMKLIVLLTELRICKFKQETIQSKLYAYSFAHNGRIENGL